MTIANLFLSIFMFIPLLLIISLIIKISTNYVDKTKQAKIIDELDKLDKIIGTQTQKRYNKTRDTNR